jgi:hypothetical protein
VKSSVQVVQERCLRPGAAFDEPPQRMLAEIHRRNIEPARAWIFKIGETRPW